MALNADAATARRFTVDENGHFFTDTTPPNAPGNLTSSGTTAGANTLSRSASSDNVGVAGYRVLRGGSQIATTGSTSYTVINASSGKCVDDTALHRRPCAELHPRAAQG